MHIKAVFYGWWIVLAASLIHFWGSGTIGYSFTAFFDPFGREFGWSYAAIAFATSFRSLESGIAAPLVGYLSDKLGPRKLVLAGSLIAGVGWLVFSRMDALWSFYATFLVLSIGASMMYPVPCWTAVTNWFSRKRGLAMGILVSSIGAAGVVVPLTAWLISVYGWRAASLMIGVTTWIICVPLSFVVRHRPEPYGLLPDGDERPAEHGQMTAAAGQVKISGEPAGFTAKQAIRTRCFWVLAIVATAAGGAINAVTVHIMPAMRSIGLSPELASSMTALLGVFSVVGRLGFGWLGDRVDKGRLLGFALLLEVSGLLVFAFAGNVVQAIVFLVLFSLGYGGFIVIRVAIQADYFGRKAFGSIQGMLQAIHMLGLIISPVFAGWIFDTRGNYQWAWLAMAALVVVAIPLAFTLRPPDRERLQTST